jgi:ribosomal-protein-alanine N-acetyltransferase
MGIAEQRVIFEPLETARLLLVLPDKADAARMVHYYDVNREHLAPWESLRSAEFYTEDFWSIEIARIKNDFLIDRALTVVLLDKLDPDAPILGQVSLRNIIRGAFQACHLGYSLDREAVGKGLMFEGLTRVITYAFDDMHLHRLMANYIPTNERSGRLLRRLGFVVEGYARDYLFLAGKWQDHVLTSLVKPVSDGSSQQVNEN